MNILASKFRFLEFRLLLSRVAPYYSSLPRTVWQSMLLNTVIFNFYFLVLLLKPKIIIINSKQHGLFLMFIRFKFNLII